MTTPVYLVVDMELVKHILTKDFNHFMDRGVYTNEKDDPIVNPATPRERRVEAHLELAELVEILARLLVMLTYIPVLSLSFIALHRKPYILYTGDGNSLTMDEIIAQSFVFFVAGYETSATTMTFALFELATRPEIQDRVRKEIKVVLRRHNDQITYDSLSELTYLTQVINETLRVYSPARFLQRQCLKNYKVPGEDVVVEKGTSVIISIKGIHYDKDYYKNPTVFDPERFNEENNKNMNSYVHLPFGQGPRACIARFGIMQVKVGLTCLLRKCKVSLNEKTKLPLKMSPNSQVSAAEGGIWLNLEDI
ncbi:hypothetical protein NQ317_000394 [Molorchus minor]|uniref:Cytochrome P450 n=1 Tax=Molorchus minor TaxID=1323400 RepID=A0ABQ9J4T9_9CUCU|nr:hypothetical protein NQ317_000394 [Molorchus minor]